MMISRKNLEFIHINNLARFQFHFARDTAEKFHVTWECRQLHTALR